MEVEKGDGNMVMDENEKILFCIKYLLSENPLGTLSWAVQDCAGVLAVPYTIEHNKTW